MAKRTNGVNIAYKATLKRHASHRTGSTNPSCGKCFPLDQGLRDDAI